MQNPTSPIDPTNPVRVENGPNYTFYYNDGTKLGELRIANGDKIPMSELDASQFAAASPEVRAQLLPRYAQSQDSYRKSRKVAR